MPTDINTPVWQAIADHFKTLKPPLPVYFNERRHPHLLHFGNPTVSYIHYEWNIYKNEKKIDVALHFEKPEDGDTNIHRLERVIMKQQSIIEGIDHEFQVDRQWHKKVGARIRFRIPYEGTQPSVELAHEAAELMKTLIGRTYDLVKTF